MKEGENLQFRRVPHSYLDGAVDWKLMVDLYGNLKFPRKGAIKCFRGRKGSNQATTTGKEQGAESIKQARKHFERDFICEKAALLAVLDTASTVMECSLVARIFKFVPTTSLLNAEHSPACF